MLASSGFRSENKGLGGVLSLYLRVFLYTQQSPAKCCSKLNAVCHEDIAVLGQF